MPVLQLILKFLAAEKIFTLRSVQARAEQYFSLPSCFCKTTKLHILVDKDLKVTEIDSLCSELTPLQNIH